jgi:FlaA1/EpsC-like NDP-sugar epimerase
MNIKDYIKSFSGFLGQPNNLFIEYISDNYFGIKDEISNSNFLVIGGAGSIGSSVVRILFGCSAKKIHVIDINENSLVELVRRIRSTDGYITKDFQTFCFDYGDSIFAKFIDKNGPYDYVMNLAAVKHVRSERDIFSLQNMIKVNFINVVNSLNILRGKNLKKYFAISTDKATSPVNFMGASKRMMEITFLDTRWGFDISTARFANVAFSNGSLLDGFTKRLENQEPLSAPNDIRRYFITEEQAGSLCILSTLTANNGEIYIPSRNLNLDGIKFTSIAESIIKFYGFEPVYAKNEEHARLNFKKYIERKKWPIHTFNTDTFGEKNIEYFFEEDDLVKLTKFKDIDVLLNKYESNPFDLEEITQMLLNFNGSNKIDVYNIIKKVLPQFIYDENENSLENKM